MTDRRDLYGTDAPPVPRRRFAAGQVTFDVEGGALRQVRIAGTEAIRGILFLVRDADWGTLVPEIVDERIEATDTSVRIAYDAIYRNGAARLDVTVVVMADGQGLRMSATGRAEGHFETNRAGFTVLHPIDGVAGCPVTVEHPGGRVEDTEFPLLIAPWQPFKEITALTHQAGSHRVTCRMTGDVFEMEDQRQWGDASFKTYNRPLALPWPYQIADSAVLAQSVQITWKAVDTPAPGSTPDLQEAVTMPDLALVLTPDDARRLATRPQDLDVVGPQRLLCHLDATLADVEAQFAAFAAAQSACPEVIWDLELIPRCDPLVDPPAELIALAAAMGQAGFVPASVLVCPSVDRQSTPPGSDWPACPTLAAVHAGAARAFAGIPHGGGMVSFFTELNRKRPPVHLIDFGSHGLCPIVHAADDLSVMETLEAVPHITRSARAILGDLPYRIGPATIAMRQNPYGSRTIPNPDRARLCMADDDPRHTARFGAAYAVGLATALAPAGVAVWTPAALYGPRGVIGADGPHPIAAALRALAALAGQAVRKSDIVRGRARLVVGDTEILANLTDDAQDPLGPFGWRAAAA